MKILYLCADHGVDLWGVKGASIHVRSFVHALAGLGHEVTVVGTKVSSPESFEAATHTAVVEAPLAWWNRSLLWVLKTGNRSLGRSSTRGRDVGRPGSAWHGDGQFLWCSKSTPPLLMKN